MKIPVATYRLQFNSEFDFKSACDIVDYLSSLGISDIYASPIFKARKKSLHGYDIIDPTQINPDFGGQEGFKELTEKARAKGLGWLQDIVTNHMAYSSENTMLMDVLENGKNSKYFKFFDIDWEHHFESLRGRVLAPFLGRLYVEELNDGKLRLEYGENGFSIDYSEIKFPLRLNSYSKILKRNLESIQNDQDKDYKDFSEVLSSLDTLNQDKDVHFIYEHIKSIKQSLWELYKRSRLINGFINENLAFFNGRPGSPESFDNLDSLINEQNFRLSFWKVAISEINYRRFFNINELICLRVEDDDVFNYAHGLLFNLLAEKKITGIRIDHLDGLYDPLKYLKKIRQACADLYIVVEKILGIDEKLPSEWPVEGTTGYDFLNYLNGIFCKQESEKEFTRTYYKFTDLHSSYLDQSYSSKSLALWNMVGSIENLSFEMKRISSNDRYGRDITFNELRKAMAEFMVNLPVYRTYISREGFSETDKNYVKDAITRSLSRMPGLYYELNFISKFFFPASSLPEEQKKESLDLAMKLQQFTGPLMAKGFEDTLLYVYNKLISLNEVGSSPNRFGVKVKDFHIFNKGRVNSFTHSMNATSTHDTKRGEDARVRINVLSEFPLEWRRRLKFWNRMNQMHKKFDGNKFMPDTNDEYLLYQAILGSRPFYENENEDFKKRIKEYMIKAVREAKVHTGWIKPDSVYEEGCLLFIDAILNTAGNNQFLNDFSLFQKKVSFYGAFNSLSQAILKITSPGVPDFYQGSELWDFSLVDPDNRRPVNFSRRKSFLEEIKAKEEKDTLGLISQLLSSWQDGKIKMFLIYRALKARASYVEIFQKGSYTVSKSAGRFKEHVVSFLRTQGQSQAIVVAPRFFSGLVNEGRYPLGEEVWQDTHIFLPKLKPAAWRNVITGEIFNGEERMPVGSILKSFPVALLIRDGH